MKPTVKAPGTKLLKLKYDGPLSSFAFKFNLRRYIVAVIQDDDLPPLTPAWLTQAMDLQREHPKLGLIAGMVGQVQGGPDTGRWGKARGRHVKNIPYFDSKGRPFMFVSWANIGPFLLRRSIFLKAGMFHQSFSCRGDPGIGFDYEYGIRLWKRGFEVGLTIMQFRYHQARGVIENKHSTDVESTS